MNNETNLSVRAPKELRDAYPHVPPKVLIRAMMRLAEYAWRRKPALLDREIAALQGEKDPM